MLHCAQHIKMEHWSKYKSKTIKFFNQSILLSVIDNILDIAKRAQFMEKKYTRFDENFLFINIHVYTWKISCKIISECQNVLLIEWKYSLYIYKLYFTKYTNVQYQNWAMLCYLIGSNVISDKEGNSLLRDFENQGICTHKKTRNI